MSDDSLPTDDVIESADDFKATYEAHAPVIYRFLFWRTHDAALSEDLTSNVFEKAWRARSSFRGGSARAWLMRIARNSLTDHWRKRADVPVADMSMVAEEESTDPSYLVDRHIELERLRVAVDKLPKDMRQVIELRFIGGHSCREVADELRISEGNVRIIQYRALKKLRGYLQ